VRRIVILCFLCVPMIIAAAAAAKLVNSTRHGDKITHRGKAKHRRRTTHRRKAKHRRRTTHRSKAKHRRSTTHRSKARHRRSTTHRRTTRHRRKSTHRHASKVRRSRLHKPRATPKKRHGPARRRRRTAGAGGNRHRGAPRLVGTAVQGDVLRTTDGLWNNSPRSYVYRWQDCNRAGVHCANIRGARSRRYRLTRRDVGHTLRSVVTAKGRAGSRTVRSAPSGVVLPRRVRVATVTTAPPTAQAAVGVAGEPDVTCSSTISVGASVQAALAAASPGQVVCLNGGSWPAQTITGLTPAAPGVTLAAVPGATVTMAGISTTGTTDNLTIEGIHFTDAVNVLATGNAITITHNNIQNFGGYAIQGCPACGASGDDLSNFNITYNQIDHTAYCLRAAANSMSNWTFSHNVCGPGIGSDGSSDDHYIQVECISGFTVDNNAFLGPFNAASLAAGAHNNVMHACGNNLTFDNNIVWHSDSRAQELLWGDDGDVSTAQAKNNLFVQDPSCGSTCPSVSMWLDGNGSGNQDSNVTFSNNTLVGSNIAQSVTGGMFDRSGGITNFTAQNNIAVNTNSAGGGDFSLGYCTSCSGNVADDGSGDVNWTPSWQNTTWTPNDGSPWQPPPPNYYKPSSLASTYGYQGSIGP
jgi:hypothetical protein